MTPPLDRHVREELWNIVNKYPVFPGNTISHQTANECVRLGLAERNAVGDFLPTAAGIIALEGKRGQGDLV